MDLKIKEDDDVITIKVKGEIEIYMLKEFKKELFAISQSANKNMTIDFMNVDYIDSSGVGFLISLYKHQDKKDKKLFITNVSDEIFHILKLTTLSDILGV
jgi:anti-sigma B factor antagonist